MAWGRWVDLTTALGFGALLIALPSLVADGGRRLILSAGAALAVAGDAIDLSQLVAYETARVGLDNGLGDTFAAGNVFRFAINTTSAYVWIAGLLLLGVGFFLMARHAAQPRLRAVLGLVAAALVVQAITDPIGGDVATIIFKGASTVFVLAFVSWVAITAPRMSGEPMLAAG